MREGWANANRTSIIGARDGGNAARAAGAETPDLRTCVAAIAGLGDLNDFLTGERRGGGKESEVLASWKN
jgi:hypothetical protein